MPRGPEAAVTARSQAPDRSRWWGLRARLPRLVGLALVAATVIACARSPERWTDTRDLSALLVVLDAAGARYFGCYGNRLPTTPHIDAFARDATLFERAYSQSSWTLPSTASVLTGRYPPRQAQHRMRVDGETLATRLQQAGLETAAFSENPLVTGDFGFSAGFGFFREAFPRRLLDERPRSYPRVASESTTDEAIAWLAAHRTSRFFVYLHLLPPHCPYDPPGFAGRFDPDYRGSVHGLPDTLLKINEGALTVDQRDIEHLRLEYEENLAFADHEVGRLLAALTGQDLLDRTVVIVTADHGEAFREHGVMLHTTTLYDEMIHVPLIVRFPPRFENLPARWRHVVELRDVGATILDALGVARPRERARSLLRRLRSGRREEAVARAWTSDDRGISLAALVTERHKLIMDHRARAVALYDLDLDPGEERDVSPANRAIVSRLAKALRRPEDTWVAFRDSGLSVTTAKKLRALGYVW